MKNISKIASHFLSWSALLLFGTGCSNFLEEPDKSNFTMENYFTKPEHAESVVNSIYQELREIPTGGFNGGPWMMLEFPPVWPTQNLDKPKTASLLETW